MDTTRSKRMIAGRVWVALLMLTLHLQATVGFVPSADCSRHCTTASLNVIVHTYAKAHTTGRSSLLHLRAASTSSSETAEDNDDSLVDDDDGEEKPTVTLDGMERAWRYAKKPLLSIGAKGATLTHGNSLRQLLEQHTVVKVKVNTRKFDGSLHEAFQQLRALAEENGAPGGIEMLQARGADKIILFGLPGTLQRIKDNEFPLSP